MAVIYPILMNVFQRIKHYNTTEVLCILVLVTLPIGGYSFNSVAVILLFLGALYNFIRNKQSILFNGISFLLIFFYIVCFSSLLWTDNLENTEAGLVRFLSYLALPLAFTFNSNIPYNREKIIGVFSKVLFFFAAYCVFIALIKSITNSDISFLFYHKLASGLGSLNAIYLSVFISAGIIFLLITENKSKFDLFCLTFLGLFLILLSSKLIIAVVALTILGFFIKKRKYKKINVKHIFVVSIISILLLFASSNVLNRVKVEFEKTKVNEVLNKKDFGNMYSWTGTGLRLFQIKSFFEIIQEQEKIFLGFGLNNSQDSLNDKYKEYNLYPGFLNYNYHNQYLQVFSELGVIGLLTFLIVLFLILKHAIIYKDYFLLSFIILILAVCITESFIWRQRGMVFFIMISLLFSKRKKYSS
jgi:O-antigen ligase